MTDEVTKVKPADRSVYKTTDFVEWHEAGGLQLTPKFQRRGVWTSAARSYFIDTLLREMPTPPIYLREIQDENKRKVIREVIDGQQRISAVLDFVAGKYALSGALLDAPWRGKDFDRLAPEEQDRVLASRFTTEVFSGIEDSEVLQIFARLNTYSVKLSAQELRNGKYFGHFKQTAYALALEHLEFWRHHRVFSEQNIARMLEVELTSELMIAMIAGMQDKKKTIDDFYRTYDGNFPERRATVDGFCRTIDAITATLLDDLHTTAFRRPPLFYTIFCVVYHRLSGLPGQTLPSPRKSLTGNDRSQLRDAVLELSEVIALERAGEEYPSRYSRFLSASRRQTDNIQPRQIRFDTLYGEAF